MNILQAALLGLVQGITEFFPVSSAGHLTLVGNLLGVEGATSLMFMIMLHIGTLIAIFSVFYRDILRIIVEAAGMIRDSVFNLKTYAAEHRTPEGRQYRKILSTGYRRFTALVLVSLIPTFVVALPGFPHRGNAYRESSGGGTRFVCDGSASLCFLFYALCG